MKNPTTHLVCKAEGREQGQYQTRLLDEDECEAKKAVSRGQAAQQCLVQRRETKKVANKLTKPTTKAPPLNHSKPAATPEAPVIQAIPVASNNTKLQEKKASAGTKPARPRSFRRGEKVGKKAQSGQWRFQRRFAPTPTCLDVV